MLYLLNSIKYFSLPRNFYQASTSEMFGTKWQWCPNWFNNFSSTQPAWCFKGATGWRWIIESQFGLYTRNGVLLISLNSIRGIQFVTRKITDELLHEWTVRFSWWAATGQLRDARRDLGFCTGDFVEAMYLCFNKMSQMITLLQQEKSHSVREFVQEALHIQALMIGENM